MALRLRWDGNIPFDDLYQAHVGTTPPPQGLEIRMDAVHSSILIRIYLQPTVILYIIFKLFVLSDTLENIYMS